MLQTQLERVANLFLCRFEELAEVSLHQTKLIIDLGVGTHPQGQLADGTWVSKSARVYDTVWK